LQDKIVADEINENIQNCIGASACKVSKSLFVNPPFKRLMKKINYRQNDISGVYQHNVQKNGGKNKGFYINPYKCKMQKN